MIKNYLTYPCKTMRITQNYTGKTSHLPYSQGVPRDYPIDEGCKDTGRSYIYCPCNKMKVVRLYGTDTKGTNSLWLQSTEQVYFADGTRNYFTMLIVHPDDDDMKKLKKGRIFLRNEKICREGKDGTTAYHFHISAGKGKIKNNGWRKNSLGKYVLTTTAGAAKPENLFYVDPEFTKVVNTRDITFKELPVLYPLGKYRVNTERLNVRTGAGTSYAKVPFESFRPASKKAIAGLKGEDYKKDHFVKGMVLTISRTKHNWGKCSSGWICLDYCVKVNEEK